MALEQLDLPVTEDAGLVLGDAFEEQESLGSGLEIMVQPDTADSGGAYGQFLQPQLFGDELLPAGRVLEGVGQDLFLDLRSDPVWVRVLGTALLLEKRRDSSELEGPAHFVEGAAVVAHQSQALETLPSSSPSLSRESLRLVDSGGVLGIDLLLVFLRAVIAAPLG